LFSTAGGFALLIAGGIDLAPLSQGRITRLLISSAVSLVIGLTSGGGGWSYRECGAAQVNSIAMVH
jgi:hypothetical protein